jgi:hypothetical protein
MQVVCVGWLHVLMVTSQTVFGMFSLRLWDGVGAVPQEPLSLTPDTKGNNFITSVLLTISMLFRITVYHHSSQRVEVLEVTDPYSRGLSADGARSLFVDLDNDASLMPEAWKTHTTPTYTSPLCPVLAGCARSVVLLHTNASGTTGGTQTKSHLQHLL